MPDRTAQPKPAPELASPLGTATAEQLRRILRSAVARACPRELDSEREDLVQSALVRILELRQRGEADPIRATSYLVKVAFTTTVDVMRRLHRRRAARLEETAGPQSAGALQVTAVPARPEIPSAVLDCLARLVESRRGAVILYLQGFSAREAARVLQTDDKRVKNLIFRGITDLRRCLLEKGVTP